MKISTLIWLKSFGGNVGRIYSSKIYAIEIADDLLGYENEAKLLSKIHSAGYKADSSSDHLGTYSLASDIIKRRMASYSERFIRDDATGITYEILGVTKHRNPVGVAGDSISAGSTVIGLTKKLGGYYLARTLPALEMEASSIVSALGKIRRVKGHDLLPDALTASSSAWQVRKVRAVMLGTDTDGSDIGSVVQSIVKKSRYIDGFILNELSSGSVVETLTKHRNPTAELEHGADIASIVTTLSKRAGKGFVSGRDGDDVEHGSIASTISKVHPFVYGAADTQMDAGSIAVELHKVRKVLDGTTDSAVNVGSAAQSIAKKRWYILADVNTGMDSGSAAHAIDKKRRTYEGLEAPTLLRAYYGDVKAPTELTATLIEEPEL